MTNTPSVVCFGEVLWDLLPEGKVAGGAPMNVAFHLRNFGIPARMISRVGYDELGRELLQFLDRKGLPTEDIQIDVNHPTSTVQVWLDGLGHATYDIVRPVAWDFLEVQPAAAAAVAGADMFVFGSLAARSTTTRATLLHLLGLTGAVKVFDVNLRPPHFSRETLEALLGQADIVKMNEEELREIGGWFTTATENVGAALEQLLDRFALQGVLVTRGKDGAVFLDDQHDLYTCGGHVVEVVDTVGSGDSFLAAFLRKRLDGAAAQDGLDFACATGALVATRKGGTPELTEAEVEQFRRQGKPF